MSTAGRPSARIARASLGLAPYVPPGEDVEAKIAAIFAEVFNLDQVGATDDFFDLGGDSLLAETLSLRLSEQLGHDFPISTLALQSSPRAIAELLQTKPRKVAPSPRPRVRPPIFIVHGRPGYTLLSADFMSGLAEGQEIHTFEAPGIRSGVSYDRIEDIAAAYIAQLERLHPEGPILIAAFCIGALIALEMATQLTAKGRPAHRIVLLDPGNPYKLNKVKRAEFDGSPSDSDDFKRRWRHYLPALKLFDRWRLGNYANDVRRYRRMFEQRYRQGEARYSEAAIPARAKLYAAYEHYELRAFHGPVVVLSSRRRQTLFRDPSSGWAKLLPQAEIHQLLGGHREVNMAPSARAMQSLFDAALAGGSDRSPAFTQAKLPEATPALWSK